MIQPHKPEDGPVLVCISGGKDSTATALHLLEHGYQIRCVFADTGWEDDRTYEYVRETLPDIVGDIVWVRATIDLPPELETLAAHYEDRLGFYSAMVRLCIKKRIFPSRNIRWCTRELKVRPMLEYMQTMDDPPDVRAVGIRADESRARANLPAFEWDAPFKCDVWRPILDWTFDDVIAIHQRWKIKPNPKYLSGATRVGCWPCVFAKKTELSQFGHDAKRVAILRDLEHDMTKIQNAKRVADGLPELETVNGWFQGKTGFYTDENGKYRRRGDRWPIDKVVAWSRTSRGGKQFALFEATEADGGCMRWGMCDTSET